MRQESSPDKSPWSRRIAIGSVVGALALSGVVWAASEYISYSTPEQPTISLLPGQTLGDLATETRERSALTSVAISTAEPIPEYTDVFLEYCTILGITPERAATMSAAELYVLEQQLSPERVLQLATLLGSEHHDEATDITAIEQIADSPSSTLDHLSHGNTQSDQKNNNQSSTGGAPAISGSHNHDSEIVNGAPVVIQVAPETPTESQETQSGQSGQSDTHSGNHDVPGVATEPAASDQQQIASTSTIEPAPSTSTPPSGSVVAPAG